MFGWTLAGAQGTQTLVPPVQSSNSWTPGSTGCLATSKPTDAPRRALSVSVLTKSALRCLRPPRVTTSVVPRPPCARACLCALFVGRACPPAALPLAGAISGQTPLSLSLRTDCQLPPGYDFRWQYVGPAGAVYPLDTAAGAFRATVTVLAPWLLPPTTAAPLIFGVRVQRASGDAVGPMLGNASATVRSPACPPATACETAALWEAPALHLRCWQCAGAPPGYLRGRVVPALRECARATHGQLLAVLQTVLQGVALQLFEPEDAGGAVRGPRAAGLWVLGREQRCGWTQT